MAEPRKLSPATRKTGRNPRAKPHPSPRKPTISNTDVAYHATKPEGRTQESATMEENTQPDPS